MKIKINLIRYEIRQKKPFYQCNKFQSNVNRIDLIQEGFHYFIGFSKIV